MSAAEHLPAFLAEQEEEEREFLEHLGLTAPETSDAAAVDAYLDQLLEQLAEAEAGIQANRDVARLRIERIQAWREEQNAGLERRAEWLRSQVRLMATGYDYGRKRSRKLPHGEFGHRRGRDTVEITDMAAAVAFAEAAGLEVKKTIGKTPLLAHLKATGEIPEGCEFVEGEDEFYVRAVAP